MRHQLAVADVALQRRAVAVEEHHDHAGLADVELLGDMHQHAAVVVGLVLPVDPAAIAAVALAVALGDVEERLFGARIGAEIGEGRGFHADQRGQFFRSVRARASASGVERGDPHGLGRTVRCGCGASATWRCAQAFAGGREAVALNCGARKRSSKYRRRVGWRWAIGAPAMPPARLGALPH